MSYSRPYVDDAGLHIPSYQDILDDMVAGMKQIYGDDIYLDNDSADYQLLSIFALKQYDTLQALVDLYNARSPQTATGVSLDSIVKLNGLVRRPAGHSTADVTLTGEPYLQIMNGAVNDTAGNQWDLPGTVVLDSQGSATVTATCSVAGPVIALAGDLTKIANPTAGWISVTNPNPATLGDAQETDAELRQRQSLSVANPSQTMLEGTLGAIYSIRDVVQAKVYENDTNISSVDPVENPYGLPAHSITAVVDGGDSNDIAAAILKHKGIGCYTNGTTSVVVVDDAGYSNTVRFYRPTSVPIYADITLTAYAGYDSSALDLVKDAIVNYVNSAGIGTGISMSMLIGVAMQQNKNLAKPVFGVSVMLIGDDPDNLAAADIDIDFNECPTLSADDIEVHL